MIAVSVHPPSHELSLRGCCVAADFSGPLGDAGWRSRAPLPAYWPSCTVPFIDMHSTSPRKYKIMEIKQRTIFKI